MSYYAHSVRFIDAPANVQEQQTREESMRLASLPADRIFLTSRHSIPTSIQVDQTTTVDVRKQRNKDSRNLVEKTLRTMMEELLEGFDFEIISFLQAYCQHEAMRVLHNNDRACLYILCRPLLGMRPNHVLPRPQIESALQESRLQLVNTWISHLGSHFVPVGGRLVLHPPLPPPSP